MALAAYNVMRAKGRTDIKIGGCDAMPPALAAVADGRMHATVRNPSCRIHGGAISAALDAMAGIAVMCAISAKHMDEPVMQRTQRFHKLGTIDLRVDFMRPGIGERFTVRAQVLRLGSRVATTRMEFLNEQGEALAVGMAAYMTS